LAKFDAIATELARAITTSGSRSIVISEVKVVDSSNRSFARRFENEITSRLSAKSAEFVVLPKDDYIVAKSKVNPTQGRTSEQLKKIGKDLKIDAVLETEVVVSESGCDVSLKFLNLSSGAFFGGSTDHFERSSEAIGNDPLASIANQTKVSSGSEKITKKDLEKTIGTFRLVLDNCTIAGQIAECHLTLTNLSSSSTQRLLINQNAYAMDRSNRRIPAMEIEIGGVRTNQSEIAPNTSHSIRITFAALSANSSELSALVISGETGRRSTGVYLGDPARRPGTFNITFKDIPHFGQ
jgi:TolB-like protein